MDGDEKPPGRERAANNNGGKDDPNPEALRKVDAVALRLARIIGRRMACEDFEKAMRAANDNDPAVDGRSGQPASDDD